METHRFCDVSLPVPLDQPFTYALPETLRHRVRPGCRLMVPFGSRKLTGVVLACHDEPPAVAARDALRLLDAEPVLDAELLALGRWIAGYYCAPLGEVLRGMLPLAAEIRRGKIYSLTDVRPRRRAPACCSTPRRTIPPSQILRLLEQRPALRRVPRHASCRWPTRPCESLERKGFIAAEQVHAERDPLRVARRAAARRDLPVPPRPTPSCPKPSASCWRSCELHPGSHNLKELEGHGAERQPGGAGAGAQAGWSRSRPSRRASPAGPCARRHALNPAQQAAFERIREAVDARALPRPSCCTASPAPARPRCT